MGSINIYKPTCNCGGHLEITLLFNILLGHTGIDDRSTYFLMSLPWHRGIMAQCLDVLRRSGDHRLSTPRKIPRIVLAYSRWCSAGTFGTASTQQLEPSPINLLLRRKTSLNWDPKSCHTCHWTPHTFGWNPYILGTSRLSHHLKGGQISLLACLHRHDAWIINRSDLEKAQIPHESAIKSPYKTTISLV